MNPEMDRLMKTRSISNCKKRLRALELEATDTNSLAGRCRGIAAVMSLIRDAKTVS